VTLDEGALSAIAREVQKIQATKQRTEDKIVALWVEKLEEAEETVADLLDDLAADLGICTDADDLVEDFGYAAGTEELAAALVRNAEELEALETEIVRRARIALGTVVSWPRDGDDDPVGAWDRDQREWMNDGTGDGEERGNNP
jgi:hypothetical protein